MLPSVYMCRVRCVQSDRRRARHSVPSLSMISGSSRLVKKSQGIGSTACDILLNLLSVSAASMCCCRATPWRAGQRHVDSLQLVLG